MRAGLLGVWLAVAGCAGGFTRVVHPPPEPLPLATALVYPVLLKGTSEPSWRAFELTQRCIEAALDEAGDRLAFYGPPEFKVMRWEDDSGWVGSTALPLVAQSGGRPEQAVVLRLSVEKRVRSSVQEAVDAKGKPGGATSSEETTWLGRAEVVHPSTRQLLVEVTGQVTTDPFDKPTGEEDYDPAPALTHLLEKLTRAAVAELKKSAVDRPAPRPPRLVLAVTPKSSVGYRDEGKADTEVDVFRMDAVQAEVFLQNRARFLRPELPEGQLVKVATLPAGSYVLESSFDGLHPGDLIEQVDAQPGLPQVLARQRFKSAPAQLRVRRVDSTVEQVPWP